jgi:branched-chain amino acid transport system ATP-binding protein
MAFLEVRGLSKNFGGLAAVSDLSFDVEQGEILGIIGPNGAGKSTVFNMICGTFKPTSGTLSFQGKNITGLPPHKIAGRGIARVFQGNVLFPTSTVLENVLMGMHLHTQLGPISFLLGGPLARRREKAMTARAMEILELVGLVDQRDEVASSQPHGDQRHICLGIALACEPTLLLLDEPVTGMNAEEVATMLDTVRMLRKEKGMTIIVVEHNMKAVMGLCDRIVTISYGKKICEGSPDFTCNDPAVIEAYLGDTDLGADDHAT